MEGDGGCGPEVDLRECANTDRELWRERDGDFYADSIHVTKHGAVGINCGGLVYVMTLRQWHDLARAKCSSADAPLSKR